MQASAEAARAIAIRRRDPDMSGSTSMHLRFAQALRGKAEGLSSLADADMTDADLRASLIEGTTPVTAFNYYYYSAELAYLSGDVERASAMLAGAKERLGAAFSAPNSIEFHFLSVLVAARELRKKGLLPRQLLFARARIALRKVARCARHCPRNFEAHALIGDAELARARGDHARAKERFTDAIAAARAHQTLKHEALALELAAELHRECADAVHADALEQQAMETYRRWGANAKAEALDRARSFTPRGAPSQTPPSRS
jgi:hypothetical protein